jgi:hypothetical protein
MPDAVIKFLSVFSDVIEILMDLRKIGWEGVNWIHLDQDRDWWWALVNTVMNLWVP